MAAPILVLDTASPVVSVAVGAGGRVIAERTLELRRSSERLLSTVEELLAEAGVELVALAGAVALQGPGSFTGLRIGLATVLGFHQAIGLRATALPTLPILAAGSPTDGTTDRTVIAAVDAIRGDWFVQRFQVANNDGAVTTEALAPPTLCSASELASFEPGRLVGFGVERLSEEEDWPADRFELVEPGPLAATAIRTVRDDAIDWDPSRLTAPIYFRPPAVTSAAGA